MRVDPLGKNPMTWKDAAIVAAILTVASFFIGLLPTVALSDIMQCPEEFVFAIFKYMGGTFFANFISLTGLAKYTEKRAKESEKDKI